MTTQQAEFTFEFLNKAESLGDDLQDRMRTVAHDRLQKLQRGHHDVIGAAVSLEQPVHAATDFLYEARVVAYARPENVAASTKLADPMGALKDAIQAVERQLRDRRAKLRDRSRKPTTGTTVDGTEVIE